MNEASVRKFADESCNEEESLLLADGFEKAFIGVGRIFNGPPIAVYDKQKCIKILCEDMSEEEAEEYFNFNVSGSFAGPSTPMFIEPYTEDLV